MSPFAFLLTSFGPAAGAAAPGTGTGRAGRAGRCWRSGRRCSGGSRCQVCRRSAGGWRGRPSGGCGLRRGAWPGSWAAGGGRSRSRRGSPFAEGPRPGADGRTRWRSPGDASRRAPRGRAGPAGGGTARTARPRRTPRSSRSPPAPPAASACCAGSSSARRRRRRDCWPRRRRCCAATLRGTEAGLAATRPLKNPPTCLLPPTWKMKHQIGP